MRRFLSTALAVLALLACQDAAAVTDASGRKHVTDRAELTALFTDRTFYGRYFDGSNFIEYYGPDGRLGYWDGCPHSGRWWIAEAMACFQYPTMVGGNTFCFDVYHAAPANDRQLEFLSPGSAPDQIAVAFTRRIAAGNPDNLSLTASGCQVSRTIDREDAFVR